MKLIYAAGESARRGTYLDLLSGQRLDIKSDAVLPGIGGKRFMRVSPLGMVLGALVLGSLYVIILPFIGVATLISLYIIPLFGLTTGVMVVGGKALGAFLGLVGRSISFGWRPMSANLAHKRRKRIHPINKDDEDDKKGRAK